MNNNSNDKRMSSKRKRVANEAILPDLSAKKIFKGPTKETPSKIARSTEIDSKDGYTDFSTSVTSIKRLGNYPLDKQSPHGITNIPQQRGSSYYSSSNTRNSPSDSAQNRLRKDLANSGLQSLCHAVFDKSQKQRGSGMSPKDNSATNSKPCQSSGLNKKYSAKDRLESLRNKIANKSPLRERLSSKLQSSSKQEISVPNKRYCNVQNTKLADQCFTTPLQVGTSFHPFEPIVEGFETTSKADEVLTEYDDSESAADFGNYGNNEDNLGSIYRPRVLNTTCTDTGRSHDSSSQSSGEVPGVEKLPSFKNSLQAGIKTRPPHFVDQERNLTKVKNYRNIQERPKPYSVNRLTNIQANTTIPNIETPEQNLRKVKTYLNTQKRSKSHSVNNRLTNIRRGITVLNNNIPGHLMNYAGKKLPNDECRKLTNYTLSMNNNSQELLVESTTSTIENKASSVTIPTHSIVSGTNNLDYQNTNVKSDLFYHYSFENESQITQPSGFSKPQLSECLYNVRSSNSRNSAINMESLSLPIADKFQIPLAAGNQPSNYLLLNHNTTVPELQCNWIKKINSNSSFSGNSLPDESLTEEPMDWCTIDESETISNLQALRRKTVVDAEEMMHIPSTTFQEVVAKNSQEMLYNLKILKEIYVVVDTNIFISHLRIIKQVLNIKINGVETPIIMIPWMVIQELDYIKDGKSGDKLQNKAQEAIRFINHKLTHKDQYVKGQSVMDAAHQDISSKSPDDGVLHCCLQIVEKRNKAILLSNDINLRNKALFHDIPAHGHNTIINALDPYDYMHKEKDVANVPKEDTRIKDLKIYTSEACSYIITELLKQSYGPVWQKLKIAKPPWSFQQCIELFIQYWLPVFSIYLNKQCAKLIQDFSTYLNTKQDGLIPIEDGEKIMDFSLSLCVYLKNGLPKFKAVVDSCINNLQNVVL